MSDATISSILSQIRGMQAQTAFRPSTSEAVESTPSSGFGESLRQAISKIDDDQKQAQGLAQRFELGDPDASLTKVMLAQQSAQLSFRATVEMRNRIVQAYQDVMNMPM
ncbi:MAG TPA: flagellar hook-basal body complex protein FliE [Rudaea sp.]|jgi:flagellar hook-basal body complex protein FliE|nr:flagellar hook-basal body complex protein FliE [Rudaea sp.]